MAKYVSLETLVKYGFLDPDDDQMLIKAEMELDSAEEEVNNDLDFASLSDYEDEDGNIPAPLITAICMKAMQNIQSPEGTMPTSTALNGSYEKKIKPYVRLVALTNSNS